MTELTICIPCLNYTDYLIKTIESCLSIRNINIFVHLSFNSIELSKSFIESKYYNHPQISWFLTGKKVNIHDSTHYSIMTSKGKWILFLSDDDLIHEKFLYEFDYKIMEEEDVYLTVIQGIDEKGNVKYTDMPLENRIYSQEEIMKLFLKNELRMSASFMIFHKKFYEKLGPFCDTGYPNGYYGDNIFFGKILANCNKAFTSCNIDIKRREHINQQSSKFYFTKEVNNYFNVITQAMSQDANLKNYILKYFETIENFKTELKKYRIIIEWSKLHNKTYKANYLLKLKFLYFLIFLLKVPNKFKLCFIISKLTNLLPNKFTTIYKKFIHFKLCKIKKYL